ncbi:hypothetical protein NL676_008736 [Syzygium grande]|nr:hypothetical protein NL676_008736 [Syzygium grande]
MSSSSPFSSLNATRSLHSIPHHQVQHQHPSSLTFPVPKPSSFRLFPKSHHHLRVFSAGSPDYNLEESAGSGRNNGGYMEEQRRFHEEQRWAHEKEFQIQALECEIQILGGDHGEVANVAPLL